MNFQKMEPLKNKGISWKLKKRTTEGKHWDNQMYFIEADDVLDICQKKGEEISFRDFVGNQDIKSSSNSPQQWAKAAQR